MPRPRSTSPSARARAAASLLTVLAASALPARAHAQACCAGGSAVTPGRLQPHEDALVGVELRGAIQIGAYDRTGRFAPPPAGAGEADFEQDLFGAVRLLRRAQFALLLPLVETQRWDATDGSHVGRGVGDLNASIRYDFILSGQSLTIPGIAVLAGITAPTGRAPESAILPLNVDATGVGAWQGNIALAAEQTWGPWLVNATGIVAKRAPRSGETLGTQVTLLAAGAYTFDSDMALALSASYTFEGDATDDSGNPIDSSSKRVTALTLSALWPFTDAWRLLGGFVIDVPASAFGSNQPATGGLTLTLIRSWS